MAELNNSLDIITININGGLMEKLNKNKAGFCDFIKKYHVIMLQETHVGKKSENTPKLMTLNCKRFGLHDDSKGYLTFFSKRRGVAIIINTTHEFKNRFYNQGNYIGVCAKIRALKYMFVSFYFHKDENEELINQFKGGNQRQTWHSCNRWRLQCNNGS